MPQHFYRKFSGFTIVELSIVIVVIAILTAITTTIYTTTQKDVADRSVQSDLVALSGILSGYAAKNGEAKAWYSPNGIDSDLNFTPSSGNVIDVAVKEESFCIRGYNPRGTKTSFADAFERGSTEQSCVLVDRSTAAGGTGGTIVGWWKLNNDNGQDYSGFGNHATTIANVAATTSQDGRSNYAYSFNGTNAHFGIPGSASLNLNGPVTVTAWVRSTSSSGIQGIATKEVTGSATGNIGNPPYGLQASSGAYLQAYSTNGENLPVAQGCPDKPFVLGEWTHVASTFDGSKLRAFVNGAQCAGEKSQTDTAVTSGAFRIGQQKTGQNRFFSGDIDDVRVYNYALSAADVASLYAKGAQ